MKHSENKYVKNTLKPLKTKIMNTEKNISSTRISPHMARLWKMLNILFTIRSFENRISEVSERIRKCNEGMGRLLPTYTEPLKKKYLGAVESFKQRIQDEELEYNVLLNEMTLLSDQEENQPILLPEERIIDYDDDIESRNHQRTCGGHSPY